MMSRKTGSLPPVVEAPLSSTQEMADAGNSFTESPNLSGFPRKKQVSTREPENIEIGPPKLTRFERARVVGARALQVSMGAPVLLDLKDPTLSPIDIALMELEEGVLPISIRRALPDGTSQNIPLKWLLHPEEERKLRGKREES